MSERPNPRGRAIALAALVAASLFWAGNYTVGAAAVRSIDPLSLTFLRWVAAAPILLVLAAIIERPDWRAALRALPRLAGLGILGMIGFVAPLYEALRHTTAVSASVISAICPVLIAVIAAIALRERPTTGMITGLAIGLVGVLVVVSKGSIAALTSLDLNIGDLWVLIAVLCWTAYTVLGRRVNTVPPITSVGLQAASVAVVLAPVVAMLGLQLPTDAPTWGAVAFIIVLPSIGSYLLWNMALRRIPAASAGVTLNLIPVFVVAIAIALGGEITLADLIGGALVLGGVLLATWWRQRVAKTPASASQSSDLT
jgi:drug/metabolite transporter (DMT)-like permease